MSGSIASGALVEYGFIAESAFGSTPVGDPFQRIRDVSFSLNLQKESYQSEARRADRMRGDVRHGYKSVAGDISGEVSEESWDVFLQAVLGGTWANPTVISSTLVAAVDSATNKITLVSSDQSFVGSGVRVGDVFFVVTAPGPVTGLSETYLTAVSVTASTIEVEPQTLATTTSSVTISNIYRAGRKVATGNTYRSFTIERWLTDRNLYQQFRGIRLNQVGFSIPASGLSTLTFSVLGRDASVFSSTSVASTYVAAPETTPYAAVNGILFEGGQELGFVTAAEITINNNMTAPQVVGTDLVPDILYGRFLDITGTITVLFSDQNAYSKFIAETESSLILRLQNTNALDENTKFLSIVLPRIKYSGGTIDDSADTGISITLPFVALAPLAVNPQQGTSAISVQAGNNDEETQVFSFAAGVPSGWTYSRASNATYFGSTGVLTVASADVARIDYDPTSLVLRGFLCEPSRTNSIRNNTAAGAVAGTPGTLPTNWGIFTSRTGITREIVGFGTENGIPYLDFKLSGTPTNGAGAYFLGSESATQIVASATEVWTHSVFMKLAGGSLSGLTNMRIAISERDILGETLFAESLLTFIPTVAALNTQRISLTRTLTNAGTTSISPFMLFNLDGGPIDFTLRIGAPQVELGPFETSPILTSGTALTRSADRLTYNLSTTGSWVQTASGYTYGAEYITPVLTQSGAATLGVAAGAFSNTNYFDSNNTFVTIINSTGPGASGYGAQINAALQVNKIAATVNFRNILFTVNDSGATTTTNPGYPRLTTLAVFSAPWGAFSFTAGWVRTVTLSNYRYTAAELRSLTT
jgi:hypothetical protein